MFRQPHGLYSPWNSLGQNTRVGTEWLPLSLSLCSDISLHIKYGESFFFFFLVFYFLNFEIFNSYMCSQTWTPLWMNIEFCLCFYTSVEMIMWFLSFSFLMWYTTWTNLQVLNHPCTPGISPSGSWYMMVSVWCWIWFSNILLRILTSIFNRNIDI